MGTVIVLVVILCVVVSVGALAIVRTLRAQQVALEALMALAQAEAQQRAARMALVGSGRERLRQRIADRIQARAAKGAGR